MKHVYLVRLHSSYRWHRRDGAMHRDTPLQVHAFPTREAAEHFTHTWSPPGYNPFRGIALDKRQFYSDLAPGASATISESALRAEASLLGLMLPQPAVKKKDQPALSDWWMWVSWWDSQAANWEDSVKATLWRLVNPNAIEIVEVELEDGR
jgi:hypothetical protein